VVVVSHGGMMLCGMQCFEHNGPIWFGRRSPSPFITGNQWFLHRNMSCDIQCDKDMVVNPEAVSFWQYWLAEYCHRNWLTKLSYLFSTL
jgi:hypothetical protein